MKFKNKLWFYFVLFTGIIFVLLWLLQIVFLQNFYDKMIINNTKKVAETIINEQSSSNLEDIIDDLAYDNSLLIYLVDTNENIIYSSDQYSDYYENKEYSKSTSNENPYFNNNETMNWQIGAYRNLPSDYDEFKKLLNNSDNKIVEYQKENSYVYGTLLEKQDAILYIRTSIEAVGNTINILKVQLFWITIISIIIAFIISYLISKLFSKPLDAISKQAKNILNKKYIENNEKGFCIELDEVTDTLNKASKELEKSDNYQRELLSNVSHDLRTPLTMIRGYAESIKDFPDDEKQRNDDLDIIIRETDRLNKLVNEILDYSKLQEKQEIKFEKVNLKKLIEKVIMQFDTLTNCIIETNLENIDVMANESQIERVLYNLIDNSIRHTKDKIKIVLRENSNFARIEVIDYGKGIKEEDITHIWDRYFSSRNNKKWLSSGLGLSIVKKIVELHNGQCGVESEIGKGSIFWVELKL